MSPHLDLNGFVQDPDTLYGWLGSFWTRIYRDQGFCRDLQASRALLSAQTYLNTLETAGLLNRKEFPVLHRERWHPIVLRKSTLNTGRHSGLTLGMEPSPVLGPQTNPVFSPVTFQLGGSASFKTVVRYPVDPAPVGMTCLVDNILNPSVILTGNQDFTLQDGVLTLRAEHDPFGQDSTFPVVPVESAGTMDQETVMWGCDALFDRDYINQYLAYCLGIFGTSTEECKVAINALWDSITSGASCANFNAALGSLYGVPTIKSQVEVVETTLPDQGGYKVVVTNKSVYRLSSAAVLRTSVIPGATLQMGEFLCDSIRVYQGVHDPSNLSFGPKLRRDIPSVSLPPGFFKEQLDDGLSLTWTPAPIYCEGYDRNGNPKLWFPVGGSQKDVAAFWLGVWNNAETAGQSLQACFEPYLDGTVPVAGRVCGYVEPLDYFLRNLIGANSILVACWTDRTSGGVGANVLPAMVLRLRETLPASSWMFLVDHRGPIGEHYDLALSTSMAAADMTWALVKAERVGMGACGLRYRDRQCAKRWTVVCGA